MLDGVDARAESGVDAVGAVGVAGDLAPHHVRGFDDGFDLVVEHLLAEARGGVGEHAAGGGDLDEIGALADAFARGVPEFIGTVGDAVG